VLIEGFIRGNALVDHNSDHKKTPSLFNPIRENLGLLHDCLTFDINANIVKARKKNSHHFKHFFEFLKIFLHIIYLLF